MIRSRPWREGLLWSACLLLTQALSAADTFWTPVRWTAPDGLHLVGSYHPADQPHQLTWVLLHGFASNKGEWGPLADGLAHAHQGVFVYDLRGQGESMKTEQGPTIDYRTWTQDVVQKLPTQLPQDLTQAVTLIHTKFHIGRARIAVGGASLGANIAMTYAANHAEVPAVILLSPGQNFGGLVIAQSFQTYSPKPILIAASPGDSYSFQTIQSLSGVRHDDALVVMQGPNAEHGVNMFKDPEFLKTLIQWMVKQSAAHHASAA